MFEVTDKEGKCLGWEEDEYGYKGQQEGFLW